MALAELLADGLAWLFDTPENAVLVALLLIGGKHLRDASRVGAWMSMAGIGVMLLAVAMLLGIVELEMSALSGLVEALLGVVGA